MVKSPQQQIIYSLLLLIFLVTGIHYELFSQLAFSKSLPNEELLLTQEVKNLAEQQHKYIYKQQQCQQATAFLLAKIKNTHTIVIAQQNYTQKDLQTLLQQMQLRDKDLQGKISYLQKIIAEKKQQITKFRKLKDYKEEQNIDIEMHKQQVTSLQRQIQKLRKKIAKKQKYIDEKIDNMAHSNNKINKIIELLCNE